MFGSKTHALSKCDNFTSIKLFHVPLPKTPAPLSWVSSWPHKFTTDDNVTQHELMSLFAVKLKDL